MIFHYVTTSAQADAKPFAFQVEAANEKALKNIWMNSASKNEGKLALKAFLKANPSYDYRGSKLVRVEK